jgi:phage shock protein PspC (stress-responsive transcriptional regulator)/predicted membrane protein
MSEHITHPPRVRRLERSASDRILAGVSGGLGRYFDLNPAFFRIGFVVLTLLGGAGVLVYLAAVLVVPDEAKTESIAEQVLRERRERPWPLGAHALAGIALIVLLSRATLWPAAGAGWIVVLVAAVAILWATRATRRATVLLRVFAAFAVLMTAAVVAAIVLAFAWFNVSLGDGIGERTYTPSAAAFVEPSYKLGVGDLRVDLSQIGAVAHPLHVRAHVGVGQVWIKVPRDLPVAVDAHANVGDVSVLQRHDDGQNAEVHAGRDGLLTIDAKIGAGRIYVVRAGD